MDPVPSRLPISQRNSNLMWTAILRSLMKQALHRPKMGTDAQANPRASGQSFKVMKISKRNRLFIKENQRKSLVNQRKMDAYGKRNCLTRTNDIQGDYGITMPHQCSNVSQRGRNP
ncbi:hypothetical protein BELL_0566g00030 [Botrytis elliptica]|uniref:Uncharacterized protein n=1 Tax=Botrytis elliptica TaxID=278938 RepID=A0A4Z1JE37_9HELO|nr:hypothetical protein BELL_0566g00030 [Botrytis elliptica]